MNCAASAFGKPKSGFGVVLQPSANKEIVPMGFATNAIHVGQEPDSATGSIVLPIYQTSTYVQEELGKDKGFDYARTNHPNRKALEKTLAKLEGGHAAYVFTSGMAAIDSVFRLLRPGDHVVLSEAVYGGVYRIATQLLVHFGLEFSFVDTSSPDLVLADSKPSPCACCSTTPTASRSLVTSMPTPKSAKSTTRASHPTRNTTSPANSSAVPAPCSVSI